ncbi:MAG TPA: hypothetical protein PLZ08_05865 [Bacillota bacterium]|nr:hypothetical protein [Bacillota bacterium]HOL09559.1 hypothetical protein [Bacillota bacterium]HPO97470.1 hypothetical protein [Bacillota bacterium]
MKKLIITLVALFSFCLTTYGAGNYDNADGDFMVFNFGDSRKVVLNKVEYLQNRHLIMDSFPEDDESIAFLTTMFDNIAVCYLDFNQDKLVKIATIIPFDYGLTLEQLKGLFEPLYDSFKQKYGEPTKKDLAGAEAEIIANSTTVSVASWELADKVILISYGADTLDGERVYNIMIIMVSSEEYSRMAQEEMD